MYQFDVYLSDMKPYDSENSNKTDWVYYLPDAMINKLNEHENWLLKCDYISLSSNISTSDNYWMGFLNSETKEQYNHDFKPSIETNKTEITKRITDILSLEKVTKVCHSNARVWSLTFDDVQQRFKVGKSTTLPPQEFRDKLFMYMSPRLGERLGFKLLNPTDPYVRFAYKKISDPQNPKPYIAENNPNMLKYLRRFYLVGDFVQASILNNNQLPVVTSFNNPYYFNAKDGKGEYGFDDPVEIDRSNSNHWIRFLKTRLWRIRLVNELMETMTVVKDHDIHLKFRFRPAAII